MPREVHPAEPTIAIGAGIIAGYVATRLASHNVPLSPDGSSQAVQEAIHEGERVWHQAYEWLVGTAFPAIEDPKMTSVPPSQPAPLPASS